MNFDSDAQSRAVARSEKTGIFINHEDLIPVLAALMNNMSAEELLKMYNEYKNNTLASTAFARGQVQDEDYLKDRTVRYRHMEDKLFDSAAQEFFTQDVNYEERLGGMELNEKAQELINFVNRRFAITALGSGDVLDPEYMNYPVDDIALGDGYDNNKGFDISVQPNPPGYVEQFVEVEEGQ